MAEREREREREYQFCSPFLLLRFMLFFLQISLFNKFRKIPKTKGWTLFEAETLCVAFCFKTVASKRHDLPLQET